MEINVIPWNAGETETIENEGGGQSPVGKHHKVGAAAGW